MTANLADHIFECILLNENVRIPIQISMQFVSRNLIDIKPALAQVPNRRQAITWTNDDLPHWRIYASLGGDELRRLILLGTRL